MKAFDPAATCPKCGHDDVQTHYVKGQKYPTSWWAEEDCPECAKVEKRQEHHHRDCQRCYHTWPEAVLPKTRPEVPHDAT